VIATSYHPKIDHLMEDTHQAEYCLPIDKFSPADLQDRFTRLVANQETIRTQIKSQITVYRHALDEQYERIFGEL
jgi:polysaccharide pyruvyl transferase WcaK-like protein